MIAVSLNYDTITFTNNLLASPSLSYMDLAYTKNCGTISTTIMLSGFIPSIVGNTLTLNVSNVIPANTVFPDGVYNFKLILGGPTGTTIGGVTGSGTYTLNFCIYIGTTSRCKSLALYADGGCKNELIPLIIKALTNVDECDECDCSTMCILYNYLQDLISNTTTITTNVYTDCGCS